MKIFRPVGIHGGFHAVAPDDALPELTHAGENWWPTHRRLTIHRHATWEFYLQLAGSSRWTAGDGDRRELPPSAFLAVPPRFDHAMSERPPDTQHFYFAGVDLAAVCTRHPELTDAWPTGRWLAVDRAEELTVPFRSLLEEIRRSQALRTTALRLALDYLVVAATRLLVRGDYRPPRRFPLYHPAVERACRLMREHPGRPWTLAALARAADLSANHLATRFRADVGTSPHRFLLAERVARAREQLAGTDLSVADIARHLGFSSGQHLARVFKRHAGMTPTAWRRSGGR